MKLKPGKAEKAGGKLSGQSMTASMHSSRPNVLPPCLLVPPFLPSTVITGLLVTKEGAVLLVPSPPPAVFQLSFGG